MKLSDQDIRLIHEEAKKIDPEFGLFPFRNAEDFSTLIAVVVDYVMKEAHGIERVRDEAGHQTVLYLRDDGPR
jgi:hypothetical protein